MRREGGARTAPLGRSIGGGRYVLRTVIGRGGTGVVYEAEHVGLGRHVAIKIVDAELASDERVVARFAREARAMSTIDSAHIVTVFDTGTEEGRPYLVMELLRGEDLGERLHRTGRVALDDALHIVAQVLKGLSKAHAVGVVHRDLKPDNVFVVSRDADPLFTKIVDFGMSKVERPSDATLPLALTGRGTRIGTPLYMSPEQAQALPDVDARADLYSVGAILFECLSGRPPHTGETYEQVIVSICMRDALDLRAIEPAVPAAVATFVARALARDRARRFSSAEDMLAALHELAPDEKTRVPLDAAGDTLVSPELARGVALSLPAAREAPIGTTTRIAGSVSAEADRFLAVPRAAPVTPEVARGPAPARGPGESGRFGPDGTLREGAGADAFEVMARLGARGKDLSRASASSFARASATPAPSDRRSMRVLVLTGAAALLVGIVSTVAILLALERPTPTVRSRATGSRSASASALAPAVSSGATDEAPRPNDVAPAREAAEPKASATSAASSTPAQPTATPLPKPSTREARPELASSVLRPKPLAPPAPPAPLDIARELP